tara:strand:+ start:380 stop:589 length:210 start_codon:yes stop_codon:yes gene_type:complete
MKIIDLNGKKIKACFVFERGNCEISVSTIFNENKPEIAVFEKDGGDMLQDKFTTITSATSWVDSFGPRD